MAKGLFVLDFGCLGPSGIRRTVDYGMRAGRSLRLYVRRPEHLAPVFGVRCQESFELGWRALKHVGSEVGNSGPYSKIAEARINFFIEPRDDLCRRIPRGRYSLPTNSLIPWNKLRNSRNIRQ